ncbi:unnamed protein product [Knipowitschia caucasica]|uniref:Oxysterol-binding protein n=1 Tax=Knipowitschia caucasica TaxID=637954 RepID=A0AAV2JPH5_KNICA
MEEDTVEHQLLLNAKEGNVNKIQTLLQSRISHNISLDIACRFRWKPYPGWTPLHMACFHGHKDVVEELLKAGADVNLQDDAGDTALHKAASTGGKEIVLLLLRYDACVDIINGTAQVPKDVTEDDEIVTMLEAAERREARRQEKRLLQAAREGDAPTLSKLLTENNPPNIHCRDSLGNTPLHCAAYRGQKQCIIKLLKFGAKPTIGNSNGQTALDVARTSEIRQTLSSCQQKEVNNVVAKIEGPLWKSSRFLGWRLHWVVIKEGNLSWYHTHADAAAGVRKQGSVSLSQAYCMVKPWDHCFFMLKCVDRTVLNLKVSSTLHSITKRKKWLEAIDAHAAYCPWHNIKDHVTDEEEEPTDTAVEDFTQALQTASTCQKKLEKEVSIFLSLVRNLQNDVIDPSISLKAKEASELSAETSAALHLCLELLSKQEEVWSLRLEQEEQKNNALTESLQLLASKNEELKLCVRRNRKWTTSTFTEDDFYDALSESGSELSVSGFLSVASCSFEEDEWGDAPLPSSSRSSSRSSSLSRPGALTGPTGMSGEGNHGNPAAQHNGIVQSRTSLPAPMFSRNDVSIWSILKKCIGMELSKIAMPVIFNEPLSFLQRLTEYMEHTYLIHRANTTTDSVERMKCVAAFAVSAVASQWERTGKPFNPLLGETYELVREDLGFRWMSEQVSHHPPVSAFHAEGLKEDFVFHGSIYPKLKFWGKSIEAEPKGLITLELPKYNEAYTWTNPTCCVHNIIVGQLWIEQYGSVEVINHKTGERCSMTFRPCGLFGKELHKVEGYILDKSKKKLCAIYGKWTECLYTVDPAAFEAHKKSDKKNSDDKKGSKQNCVDEEPEEVLPPEAETVQVIPGSELIWKITPRPENSSKYYAFSTFAMLLNELEKSMEGVIPPTDSRFRPDIRAMENGDIDLASAEKKRVEEKQRMARKNRSKSSEEWKNRWFQQGSNPHNKAQDWLYLKGYWDRNYTQLPDIY